MKIAKTYLLGLAVGLSLALSFAVGNTASAVSEWDQSIVVTPDLRIPQRFQSGQGLITCTEIADYSYSASYMGYLIDNNGLTNGIYEPFINAPENATWAVVNSNTHIIYMLFYGDPVFAPFTEPNGDKTFRPTVDVPAFQVRMSYQTNCPTPIDGVIPFGNASNGYNPLIGSYYGGNIQAGGSSLDQPFVFGSQIDIRDIYGDIYLYTGTLETPPGYDGAIPPDTTEPPSPGTGSGAVPNITWEYDNLDVGFYSDRLKNANVNLDADYQIYWHFSNATIDPGQNPEEIYTVSGCTLPDFPNEHTVPVLGAYTIQAYYADSDCNILSRDLDGKLLNSNEVTLILDGGSGSGSTEIDVRDFTDAQRLQIAFRNAINANQGLEGLLIAPLEVVYHVAAWNGECEPITLPILGSNEPMNCIRPMINSAIPAVAAIITVAVNGTVAWLLVVGAMKQIKRTFDPDYNKIEVFSL